MPLNNSGNVSEWCWDWFGKFDETEIHGVLINPKGPKSGEYRIHMGLEALSSSTVQYNDPDALSDCVGLRLVRSASD